MTSPRVEQTVEYVKTNWSIFSALAVGLVLWGGTIVKVEALEEKARKNDEHSERIVRIETQITTVQTSVGEIKRTMKEQNEKFDEDVEELEQTINSNFQQLLLELRQSRGG